MKPTDFDFLIPHFTRLQFSASSAPVRFDAKKRLKVLRRKKQMAVKDAGYYERNREKRLEASKAYLKANPEKNREACRRYREKLKRSAASRERSEPSPQS